MTDTGAVSPASREYRGRSTWPLAIVWARCVAVGGRCSSLRVEFGDRPCLPVASLAHVLELQLRYGEARVRLVDTAEICTRERESRRIDEGSRARDSGLVGDTRR